MLRLLAAASFACAIGACVTGGVVSRRDDFPLDPREELTGPFSPQVEEGSQALLMGDNDAARRAFAAARSGEHGLAADIGWIEATVLSGRPKDALEACEEALSAGEPTLPLLVACGEARARSGDDASGFALYKRAAARRSGRHGIEERARELQRAAGRALMTSAMASAAESRWDDARHQIARAIELVPDSAVLRAAAGEIETAAGDRDGAIQRYKEALDRDPGNHALREKVANLALESQEYGLAASLFEELARGDPQYRARSEEARQAFRVANWPAQEREAARSDRITRAGAAILVWWMFPEVREARVSSAVIASDVVGRRDSRALGRAVALGLLETDHDTHRAHPDQPLTLAAAARLTLRLLALLRPTGPEPCEGVRHPPRAAAEIVRVAAECGVLEDDEEAIVSGPALTRALDRVRTLATDSGNGR